MSERIDFSTLIPDNVDLTTGDQGELIFVSNAVNDKPAHDDKTVESKSGASPEGTGATAGEQKTTEAQTTSQVDAPAAESTPASVDWEKRYKDLQADYTRKTQKLSDVELRLAEVAGKVDALTSGRTERTPGSDEGLDSLDSLSSEGDGIEAKVEKLVTKTLEKVLGTGSAEQIKAQSQYQRELDAVVTKYDDFKDFVPAIKQVMDKLPELHLNFEQAYLLTKKLASEVKTSTPAKEEATKTVNTQAATHDKTLSVADAAKLADKAKGLRTEQGVATDSNQKRAVKSLRDCVAASWEEVGLA